MYDTVAYLAMFAHLTDGGHVVDFGLRSNPPSLGGLETA